MIKSGSIDINKIVLGDQEIGRAYMGSTKVFEKDSKPSLLEGLVASYAFENNTNDSHINGLDLVWSGSEEYYGGIEGSFAIRGDNRSGTAPVVENWNMGGKDFSCNFWYQKNDAVLLNAFRIYGSGTGQTVRCRMRSSGGVEFIAYDHTTGDWSNNYVQYLENAGAISNNTWYMISINCRADGRIEVWRNGVKDVGTVGGIGTFTEFIDDPKGLDVCGFQGGKGFIRMDAANFWIGRLLDQDDIDTLYAEATRSYPFGLSI